jgi:type 1 glutamine amidotransferase
MPAAAARGAIRFALLSRSARGPARLCAVLAMTATLLAMPIDITAQSAGAEQVPILLLTGQSSIYHDWQQSSRGIERILDATGLFDLDVLTTPLAGESMADFAPDWSRYAGVVLDYDGDAWPEATRSAFAEWLASGRGLVLVHAADNAFPDWPEFQLMAGVGGWRGRDESAGPMLRWRDGGAVLDTGPGTAVHPPQHDFQIVTRAPEHPVMRGLPEVWMHAHDELYSQLRGPARNVTILATARAEPSLRGATGEHEPMLLAVRYGEGRVFHTTLGHVGPRDEEPVATLHSVGFIVTLQRGTEWAATGEVTQTPPDDFPDAGTPSLRALP